MKEKEVKGKGVTRRDFFKLASAAGFGTVTGTYLFSVPDYDFGGVQDVSGHSLGVLYRIKEANVTDDANSYSITEVVMEPGSETYVMYNEESQATLEGVSGQAVILTSEKGAPKGGEKVQKRVKKKVKPRQHFQMVNPSKERAHIVQKFQPIWKPDKSFIKVGKKLAAGSDLWFELRETINRQETALKYRLVKSNKGMALLDVRVEPGVKSAVEFHKNCRHSFRVKQGQGIIVVNGKKKEFKEKDKITIDPGTKFQLINPTSERWELSLKSQPGWRPEDAYYVVRGKTIPGADVWFGIHIS
jgi:mannose-6-phosphate isomerase-like protein (cupin superfamily)